MPPYARYVIGIAIPFLSVVPTVPLLGRLDITIFGAPLALVWLFACIPLASLCLGVCWLLYDRHLPEERIDTDYGAGSGQ